LSFFKVIFYTDLIDYVTLSIDVSFSIILALGFFVNLSIEDMGELNGVIIPTIDLEEVSDKILNQKIREASERWGCFRVINHGVSLSLMAEMKKTVIDLFQRPYEVKVRNTDVLLGSGYRAPNEINPYYEALGLYDMASPHAVNTFCDQLEASADQRLTSFSLV
jgi:hypothetical protein